MNRKPKKKKLASRLKHYVDFQEKSKVADGEGGFNVTWVNISGATSIPVEILPIRAVRKEEMQSRNVHATHYIRSRFNIPIDEIGRISWTVNATTRYFIIHSEENIQEADYEVFLIAEEIRD